MTDRKTWRFEPLDTWFFRESRPHGAVGGSELVSLFPPPVRTLVGSVRSLLGELAGVDWYDYKRDPGAFMDIIGHGDDLGPLRFRGPWLIGPVDKEGGRIERLYPAPAFLVARTQGGERKLHRLAIGDAVACDLGRVRLPKLTEKQRGAKPLEDTWLTAAGLQTLLKGELPDNTQIIDKDKLFEEESRLGIARSNAQRTVEQGMLYQTRHLRFQAGVGLELEVGGVALDRLPERAGVRLGGEGRLALVTTYDTQDLPAIEASQADGLILCLMTNADPGDDIAKGPMLPGFKPASTDGDVTVWKGNLNGIALTCHCAVLGKARREGGWDLLSNRPRPVRSLIPAGSAWFCTVDDGDIAGAIKALHGTQIGDEQKLGRGQLAVGLWNDNADSAK